MTLEELNALEPSRAEAEFRRCCGSARWAGAMAGARPFADVDAMIAHGETIWTSLEAADWLEAFAAHPRIGERRAVSAWSSEEQAGMRLADQPHAGEAGGAQRRLSGAVRLYLYRVRDRQISRDMLALLEARLSNDAPTELAVAAEEQRKITALRLRKLVTHD